jgi:NTP pyrophosphatase (non-canonical NTP hydrolase)
VNRTEHLLACLAEECAEVSQRVSKALRFGLDEVQPGQGENNRDRISEELNDLFAVANILMEEGILLPNASLSGIVIAAKRAKIEKFMAISREQGVLQ